MLTHTVSLLALPSLISVPTSSLSPGVLNAKSLGHRLYSGFAEVYGSSINLGWPSPEFVLSLFFLVPSSLE